MNHLDDFLDTFNWITRGSNLIWQLLSLRPHRDLRGRWQFTPGLVEMRIERQDDQGQISQTGGDAERLLHKFGIPIHGRRVRDKEFILSVPAQQANWAEYLLASHMTMAASHRWHNPDNARYGARRQGRPVPAWADHQHPGEAGGTPADAAHTTTPDAAQGRQAAPARRQSRLSAALARIIDL